MLQFLCMCTSTTLATNKTLTCNVLSHSSQLLILEVCTKYSSSRSESIIVCHEVHAPYCQLVHGDAGARHPICLIALQC